ncbi:thioredoxin domain-containing protein [Frondihabitans sp. VKM Ac-2883]|uniref:DsbA family protein n=1 Tax=Frondihabitans sp. VKM Ac-2883 TaxID=2783823 RepID=UPI00188C01EA|nr:thioredoxin domain-containing protein [Frondihabitans sp. VKM Ac-2883]MBF4576731.1 thioredoxin domain-containing protein [Frondihabitans sp. VKM Ac-2883]
MTPPPETGQTKRDRRDEAREKARVAREAATRRRRRNKSLLISGIIVGALALVTAVTLIIVSSVQPAGPGPKNMASGGILLQGSASTSKITAVETKAVPAGGSTTPTDQKKLDKTVNISVYLDYQCPYCNQFETTNEAQISTWLKKGAITYEIHPISILDASSLGTKYSTRSANAAMCVANYDPDSFLAVNTSFFANQPAEGSKGLTDEKLKSLITAAGATSPDISSCIDDGTFKGFVADQTKAALNEKLPNSSLAKLTGTPTVIVNGQAYSGSLTDAAAFSSFVTSQATS